MQPDIKTLCRGKWHDLLPMFGIDKRFLINKHGPCPACAGTDRFRFDNKNGKGTYFCSQCGAGNGFSLIMKVTGMDFKSTARELLSRTHEVTRTEAPEKNIREDTKEQRNALWRACKPIEQGDFVSQYLTKRGLGDWKVNSDFKKLCEPVYWNGKCIGSPGLVAMVRSPDGKPATLLKTSIQNGKRAGKRYLSVGSYPVGSAIRIDQPAQIMGVAEGMETAKSASILAGIPVWALINADNLSKFVAPKICKKLIIFADFDLSFIGQWAAYTLAKRHKARSVEAVVKFPDTLRFDFDWNDKHLEVLSKEKAA